MTTYFLFSLSLQQLETNKMLNKRLFNSRKCHHINDYTYCTHPCEWAATIKTITYWNKCINTNLCYAAALLSEFTLIIKLKCLYLVVPSRWSSRRWWRWWRDRNLCLRNRERERSRFPESSRAACEGRRRNRRWECTRPQRCSPEIQPKHEFLLLYDNKTQWGDTASVILPTATYCREKHSFIQTISLNAAAISALYWSEKFLSLKHTRTFFKLSGTLSRFRFSRFLLKARGSSHM